MDQMAAAAHAAAAGESDVFEPPPTTYIKSERQSKRGRAAADIAAEILSDEDACKWRKLNSLYGADEWEAAADAPTWDDPNIPRRIQQALDETWRIELAKMARAHAERQREQARKEAGRKRTEKRRAANRALNTFLKEQGLSIVHEAAVPRPHDEHAELNPLSQQYVNRPRRKRKAPPAPKPLPPLPAELEAAAAARGVAIVSSHKEKRQQAGGAPATSAAAADAALAALDPLVAAAIAAKYAQSAAAAHVDAPNAAAQTQQAQATKGDQQTAYYQKVKKHIYKQRAKKELGSLSKASRLALRNLANHHYKDGDGERGFAGSALVTPWHAQFYDATKHPATDDTDSESEQKEGDEADGS